MTRSHLQRGKMVNAFDPNDTSGLDPETGALVARRTRLLGPAYRLFYSNPVHIVRGEGVHLYGPNGERYLDAYNNVVSVGHGHPRVVEAITGQLQTLCTHTRYIQDGILDLSEQLLGTFGGRIGAAGHMMFTCTGSEANDLAMRIAMHKTGRRGIIITSEAYHGNSHLTAGFSPSLGEGSSLGTWVRRVPTPDSYRMSPDAMAAWFAGHVEAQVEDLRRHGEGVAAMIVDSLFSSDGIYSEPADLLAPAAEIVRKAGGLFVADEVQCGYGRTGETMWGYQRHGLDPDIVTLGKPMGNGYPVAGLAVAPEIVADFGTNVRYFNTFGGNSVAIAAARAVLGVVQEEELMQNAARVGRLIRDGIGDLAQRYEAIGDVRGTGLYIGVELVRDRNGKAPDASLASAVVNGLRDRRILISATGYHANILKIRPPLTFSQANAAELVEGLSETMKSLVP